MATDIARAGVDEAAIAGELATLTARLEAARWFNIGFPGATDVDFTPLGSLLSGQLLNNIGDPMVDGIAVNHTKALERAVVDSLADLFRAPPDDRWGYVTAGGSEGNLYALHLAATHYPDAMVYASDHAHPSVMKAASLAGLPLIRIRAGREGVLDHEDLANQIGQRRDRAVIVVATAGTTMWEAVDDLHLISHVLDDLTVRRRFVHVDAALSGVPLALLDPDDRPGFDFVDGADSISVSGHKFLGVPTPCGVVITRSSLRTAAGGSGYAGSPDTTITGSRSGHTPLMLWYALSTLGVDGLRRRADAARELADYTHRRLTESGWEAFRYPHAFTVVLRTPPTPVIARWVLVSVNGFSHLITMPGVARDQIDEFLTDLANASPTTVANDRRGRGTTALPAAA
jgi:histidine decarboxylase